MVRSQSNIIFENSIPTKIFHEIFLPVLCGSSSSTYGERSGTSEGERYKTKENNNQINSGSTKEFVVSLSPRMLFDRTVKYFLVAQLVVLIMDAVATNKPIVYLELISDTM